MSVFLATSSIAWRAYTCGMANGGPPISAPAATRRENARQLDGKFGEQPKPEVPPLPARDSSRPLRTATVDIDGTPTQFTETASGQWNHSGSLLVLGNNQETTNLATLCDAVKHCLEAGWVSPDDLDGAVERAEAWRDPLNGLPHPNGATESTNFWRDCLTSLTGVASADGNRVTDVLEALTLSGVLLKSHAERAQVPAWFWAGLVTVARIYDPAGCELLDRRPAQQVKSQRGYFDVWAMMNKHA